MDSRWLTNNGAKHQLFEQNLIDYLHTPSARGQLIKYIRTQEREARLDEAIDGLNQYLKNL